MLKYLNFIVILAVVAPIYATADQEFIPPTDDARVWELFPTTNYGSEDFLTVGYMSGWFCTCIKFDLSPYSGTNVTSAYLRLYVYDSVGAFPTDKVYRATNNTDWSEDSLTWDNKPGYDIIHFTNGPSTYSWWVIDVTYWIKDIVDGTKPNYGFAIGKGDTDADAFYMRSKEYSNSSFHPELELNYTTGIESATLGSIKAAFK